MSRRTAAAALLLLAAVGCSTPATAPATPSAPATLPAKYAAVADDLRAAGVQIPGPLGNEASVVKAADGYCASGATRSQLVDIAVQNGMTAEQGRVLIESSVRNVCPGKVFAPEPTGPLTVIGPGLYEVGTGPGQIAPGKYRTPGPDGSSPGGCYFGRWRTVEMDPDGALGYDLSQGPTILVVQPTDGAVKIGGCTFTRAD